MSLQKAS
jgi:hypothetical protein